MRKFSKIIALFLILLLFSCSSSKTSENDTDVLPDTDTDSQDVIVDNDSDSEEDSDFIDDLDEVSDSDIDADSPAVNCIYIYEGREDSKLCFGPKKTNVKCKANPKEKEYVSVIESNNSLGDTEGSMDINDDFIFFELNSGNSDKCFEGKSYCPNIYGCNRKDEYVYEIVVSKFIHHFFAVDGNHIVFKLWDSVKSDTHKSDLLFLGDLNKGELTKIADWSVYGKMQMKYPIVAFLDYLYDKPLIINLETNTTKKITDLKCNEPPQLDGKNLVCNGKYSGIDDNAWMVDLETCEISPLSVLAVDTVRTNINGNYAFIDSGRDMVYYANSPSKLSGMEIYSLNLKTKREEKWTPEIKGIFEGNFTMPSFEYPYFVYLANETEQTSTGVCYALNIETGELVELWERTSDSPIIKDRYVFEDGYFPDKLAKLPDLPKLPENADELCEDNNPCTDNRYFVTDGECHFIPNHERCDDDDTTTFDICIDGECKGFAGTSTDEEMVTVEAGKFLYDGKEYEIEKPFKMDVFEVTNGKYAECVAAKACVEPLRKRSLTVLNYYGNPFYDNFPVLYINQFEAQNYCNWLGKRLPTEFEWMKATWDGEERTYLWGEEKPDYEAYPDTFYANTTRGYPQMTDWDVVEVGTFPKDKTIGGIMDMSGNVSEWTTSEWTKNLCDTPPCHGKFGNDLIVTKGGAYTMGPELATRYPATPWSHSFFIGFRCVRNIEETENEIRP